MISILIGVGIVIFGVILDQIVKGIVSANMELHESINVINGFFKFTYTKNSGAAFSLFEGNMPFLIVVTIIAFGVFIYLFKDVDFKKNKLYSFGLSMMVSGTIGNFIDRVRFHKVVDMFDFIIFGYDFPVFNIADILLTVGITLFAIEILFFCKKGENDDEGIDDDLDRREE